MPFSDVACYDWEPIASRTQQTLRSNFRIIFDRRNDAMGVLRELVNLLNTLGSEQLSALVTLAALAVAGMAMRAVLVVVRERRK